MEINEIKKVIEALLFVSDKPLLTREIKAIIKEDLSENDKLEDILKQMQEEYVQLNRAFELKFVADGWTFATKSQYSPWIKKLLKEKTILKLSPSAMEVLAIIAYKQPITRAEIDNIRGVDCGGVIDTLSDRKFIKIVGRKESLGRPLLYGTTQDFLRHFGLSHLSELPIIENADTTPSAPTDQSQELPFETNGEQKQESTQNIESPKEENVTISNENEVALQENINQQENVINEIIENKELPKEENSNISNENNEIQQENAEQEINSNETSQDNLQQDSVNIEEKIVDNNTEK